MDILRKTLKYLDYKKSLSVYFELITKKKEYISDFKYFLRRYNSYLFRRKLYFNKLKKEFLTRYVNIFQLNTPSDICSCNKKATNYFIFVESENFKCKGYCHSCIYRHLYSYYERYSLYYIDDQQTTYYNIKAHIPFISWASDYFNDIKEDLNKNKIKVGQK